MTPALTAWLLLAAVLVASGVGKLRHPEGTAEAMIALKVPDALNRPWLLRAHPWAEIVLAVLLLTLPHPASLGVAVVALALFTTYLLLVWRVVASGEEASCNCFGSLGSGTVDGWTVTRNAVLVAVALVTVVDAATGGSAIARFGDLGTDWWWVLGLVVTAAVTYLVVREGDAPAADELEVMEPEEDYLRLPIPDVPVRAQEGGAETSLRDLAGERAQVLLLLNPGCGPCKMITGRVADWAREVPEIDFRVLHAMTHENARELVPAWDPFYVQEVGGAVGSVFGQPGRPAAILLGMDGLLAGGPVQGHQAVEQLVADLTEQITAAREANAEAVRLNEEHAAEAERLESERVAQEWAQSEETTDGATEGSESDSASSRSAGAR
nr:MauE/DoxX family redox-associated membrane protein [Ornithinimicrobium sp. F0845]